MAYRLALYVDRAKALDSALCIRVNQTSRYQLIRVLFRLVSRLGDGVFWYTVMLGIVATQGMNGLFPVFHMASVGLVGIVAYRPLSHPQARALVGGQNLPERILYRDKRARYA